MSRPLSAPPGTGAQAGPRLDVGDASIGDLISNVTRDLSTLMRQEFELATAELKQEVVKSGKAAGSLGAAGFAGYMVLLFLSVALWSALANVMPPGRAALIVAALWAIIASSCAACGLRQNAP
jgi:hypothetical protein